MNKKFLMLFFVSFESIQCMNRIEYDFIVQQTILQNNTLPHSTLCKLACVNKEWNKEVSIFSQEKRVSLEKYMRENNIIIPADQIAWHKDGTRCAWINTTQKYQNPFSSKDQDKWMQLRVLCKDSYTKDTTFNFSNSWHEFCSAISEEKNKPIFDNKGNTYFYGHGYIPIYSYGSCGHIVEYSIDHNGEPNNLPCVVENANLRLTSLIVFLKFPSLLKAIMQSSGKRKRTTFNDKALQYNAFVFDINKVTIPDDYDTYIGKERYSSFTYLPDTIKKAIIEKYEKQLIDDCVAKELVLHHSQLSHNERCALACVDKKWKNAVDCLAKRGMDVIRRYIQKYNNKVADDKLVWSKTGNECAVITEQSYYGKNDLPLYAYRVSNGVVMTLIHCFCNYFPADSFRLFFKGDDIAIYGYSMHFSLPDEHCLIQYMFYMNDNNEYVCDVIYKDKKYSLCGYQNFPILVRALFPQIRLTKRPQSLMVKTHLASLCDLEGYE